jgi:cell division protein FtsB
MKWLRSNGKRIAVLGTIVILVLLMMDFNNRMGEYQRLKGQEEQVSAQVGNLQATEQTLKTQIAYATSDSAVEEWAREQGHMIQPGDVPIVPLAPPNSTPPVTTLVAPTPEPVSNWQVWQTLFLGK